MTLAELNTVLRATNLPVAYVAFADTESSPAPSMPFITYESIASVNFIADGIVYHPVDEVEISLFSKIKDITNETNIESALATAGLFWQKESSFDEDESCFITTYTIEI